MQKRGRAGPDDGDALALTFAQPVEPTEVDEEDEEEAFGRYWQQQLGVDAMTPPRAATHFWCRYEFGYSQATSPTEVRLQES